MALRPDSALALARGPALATGAAGVAMWPVPVFGVLHAESSAVIATAGCLAAAIGAVGPLRRGVPLATVARAHLGALLVPLALLTLSLLWRPNCAFLTGLSLFAVLVPPSVLFGLGVASATVGLRLRGPRVTGVIAVLAVALAGVVYDLGWHPQFFTYSHVFGGVLGPIYDAELAVRPGLFAAKAQTLLWAVALAALGAWGQGRGRRATVVGAVALVALGASYLAAAPLGIVQSERQLRRVLSATVDAGPVVLHLDPETSPAARRRLAVEARFRFDTLSDALSVVPSEPVDIYLYPDTDTKAALVGSRYTSVVPVWLPSPQVHMLADEVGRSLGHELVHVLAREFGMGGIKASPAIGLVEGLAVALEPPDGLPGASALVRADDGVLGDPADAVVQTMSPGGFWTARAGIAYTANGAFVRWLLDTYGAGPVKAAYRTGRFAPAFGRPLAALAQSWAAELGRQPVDPEAVAVARWLFSRPSLFEVRCPHHTPRHVRLARAGAEAFEGAAFAQAADLFGAAAHAEPFSLVGVRGSLAARLALGHPVRPLDLARAQALADSLPDAASLAHLADVRRLSGRPAADTYRAAADSLAPVDALGRLLLAERARLGPGALRRWLASPPDSVSTRSEREAPVQALFRLLAADEPARAWAVARQLCPDNGEGGRVIRYLQAVAALRAGASGASEVARDGLADAFASGGPRSWAPLARDLDRRVEWHRTRGPGPSIFAAPPTLADALVPCPPARRARAAGGLRDP
ncbi:hypothetical protein [Rubrivirga sp. IMCC45206]|uniref:hypothetical protein n=1 Tax=Rubrivirga sp. IMCC45206 TaxID=3391614 RepID=UPI0039901BC4